MEIILQKSTNIKTKETVVVAMGVAKRSVIAVMEMATENVLDVMAVQKINVKVVTEEGLLSVWGVEVMEHLSVYMVVALTAVTQDI